MFVLRSDRNGQRFEDTTFATVSQLSLWPLMDDVLSEVEAFLRRYVSVSLLYVLQWFWHWANFEEQQASYLCHISTHQWWWTLFFYKRRLIPQNILVFYVYNVLLQLRLRANFRRHRGKYFCHCSTLEWRYILSSVGWRWLLRSTIELHAYVLLCGCELEQIIEGIEVITYIAILSANVWEGLSQRVILWSHVTCGTLRLCFFPNLKSRFASYLCHWSVCGRS